MAADAGTSALWADFRFSPLSLAGVWLIDTVPKVDSRGHFERTFCADIFRLQGLETSFVQRSNSFNAKRATLRGLHFQRAPAAETKLVRCTRGAICDVVVDIRPGSKTFGKHLKIEMRSEKTQILYVPEGFAHGFLTLVDSTEVYYEITPTFQPSHAAGVRWNDPGLAIDWPLVPQIISERDRMLPALADFSQSR